MDALEAIARRHSTRRFSPRPIPLETLEKLVDAGRRAATSRNEQPWAFVVVTNKELLFKVANATDYGKFIAAAAACVAVFCRGSSNHIEDGAAAAQNILVAATALGVQSCWVAGHGKPYSEVVSQILNAPQDYHLVALLALGYEAVPAKPPRKRRLSSVLHWEQFRCS